eukprot:scaffold28666_cov38-Prasinocladus_malaysianus.AAC.2
MPKRIRRLQTPTFAAAVAEYGCGWINKVSTREEWEEGRVRRRTERERRTKKGWQKERPAQGSKRTGISTCLAAVVDRSRWGRGAAGEPSSERERQRQGGRRSHLGEAQRGPRADGGHSQSRWPWGAAQPHSKGRLRLSLILQGNPDAIEAAARTIGNFAMSQQNSSAIQAMGGLPILLDLLQHKSLKLRIIEQNVAGELVVNFKHLKSLFCLLLRSRFGVKDHMRAEHIALRNNPNQTKTCFAVAGGGLAFESRAKPSSRKSLVSSSCA